MKLNRSPFVGLNTRQVVINLQMQACFNLWEKAIAMFSAERMKDSATH